MLGPTEEPRYINGAEIQYGSRSTYDMDDWICEGPNGCGMINKAIRFLVFDAAPLTCGGCRQGQNPNDFFLSLAHVEINNINLINEVKTQEPKECVANAVSQLGEIVNKVVVAISTDEENVKKAKANCVFKPSDFFDPHNRKFDKITGGIHKSVHMLQRFTHGRAMRMKNKWFEREAANHYFRADRIRMVQVDDFEEVTRRIADGTPLLVSFYPGVNYMDLNYCEYYTPVPRDSIEAELKDKRDPIGHCLVIIGVVSEANRKAYIALDEQGKAFCKQVGDEGWLPLLLFGPKWGGFGKVAANSYFMNNFFMLSREQDYGIPAKMYVSDYGGEEIDLVLDREDENARKLSKPNRFKILHGPTKFV